MDRPEKKLNPEITLADLQEWAQHDGPQIGILTGGAGTGKTTMLRNILDWAQQEHVSALALAPTGRAARVIQERTGHESRTIHSAIYSLADVKVEEHESDNGPTLIYYFPLKDIEPDVRFVIIDEASMVGDADQAQEQLRFGSGKLLSDLLKWARLNQNPRRKILFVGDPYQLPPVGDSISRALNASHFEHLGLRVVTFCLTTVHRQKDESGIRAVATELRNELETGELSKMTFPVGGGVNDVSSAALVKAISSHLSDALVVARSNSQVLNYNKAIRSLRWNSVDTSPKQGDQLLVVKNSRVGLLNGDIVKVTRLGQSETRVVSLKDQKPVKLLFRDMSVRMGPQELEVMVLENLLDDPSGQVPFEISQALVVDFERRVGFGRNSPEYKEALLKDPFVNALLVKYGYAVTCHKAQGGEWHEVYVDFEGGNRKEEGFRWCYTAVTRAKHQLNLVNPTRYTQYSNLKLDVQASLALDSPAMSLWPEGVKPVLIRHIQNGATYEAQSDGASCRFNRFENKKGKVSLTFLRGERALFQRLELHQRELEAASVPTNSHLDNLLAEFRSCAPAEGSVRVVKVQPYRVSVEFTVAQEVSIVDITHDKSYKFKIAPNTCAPMAVEHWINEVAKL